MKIYLKKIIKKYFFGVKYMLPLLILTSVMVSLVGCGPTKITISPVTVSPDVVGPNEKVTIAVNVLNLEKKDIEGYELSLMVNSIVKETKTVTLGADQTTTFTFEYIPDATGSYTVDINGQSGTFTVVKPASFKVGQLTTSPISPTIGQEIVVSADIQNEGELTGTYTATFKVDDNVVKTEELMLGPGQTTSSSANFTPGTIGRAMYRTLGSRLATLLAL